MEIAIRDWTPAETLIILNPNAYNGREMVKYTLLDLIAKGVLQYEKVETEKKPFCNLSGGPALHTYTPRPHESVFLLPFKQGQPHIQLKLFLKILKQNVGGYYAYRNNFVRRSFLLQPYFKTTFWNALHVLKLSDKGKALQAQFKAEMQAAREALKSNAYGQQEAHLAVPVLALGANVLLLAEMDALMRRKDLHSDLAEAFSDLFTDDAMHTLGEAWSDVIDAFSDGGSSGDGGGSGGDSGCGSSGCGSSGCGAGCGGG